jgi:hypothetical protein
VWDPRAEAIGRSEFRSEEVGDGWVRKVKQAGALSGEMPSRGRPKPLRLGVTEVEKPL